ncbi:MAG: 50S ribosomal protein L24 [Spirochaetes bacterium GWF1_49_6]|jgi:large subunit ribosomal protein L24|nr:MAG: 50S ribosomal protein L24 [Spirochaetes bacterium GWF1_49_6]
MAKLKVRKGDTVIVIAGSEKGKKGEIVRAMPTQNKVVVKGVNYVKKTIKKSKENPNGGFLEIEAPLHVSNVMLFCPKNGKGVRVGFTTDKNGNKKRKARAKGVDYIFE